MLTNKIQFQMADIGSLFLKFIQIIHLNAEYVITASPYLDSEISWAKRSYACGRKQGVIIGVLIFFL